LITYGTREPHGVPPQILLTFTVPSHEWITRLIDWSGLVTHSNRSHPKY